MIYALIAIIGMGFVIAVLAIIAIVTLQRNDHLEREKKVILYDLESALAGKEALKEQVGRLIHDQAGMQTQINDLSETLTQARQDYNRVLRERNELQARNTALVEAMEAKPTQAAKRVRKDGAQAMGEQP